MTLQRFFLIFVFFVCFSGDLFARDHNGLGPISLRNQNPVYLQSLSLTPGRAVVLPEGTIEFRIDSAYSNIFERNWNSTQMLDLDMEYWRIVPQITYGIANDMEIGVEVPLVHFAGGFLDSFVQKFHKFFGFPNGGREMVEDNRFSYQATNSGNNLFDYPSAELALGDIAFHFKNQMRGETKDKPAVAWFFDLKFPTGKDYRGTGSGQMDAGFGGSLEKSWKRLHGYFNAGYYVLGINNAISDYAYNQMLAYSFAGELTILPTWTFIVQLDGSTPLLNGLHVHDWEGVPLDFIIGFKGELQKLLGSHDFIWQLGFSEDVLSSGPSVDFTVFVSLGVRFDLFGRSRPAGDWLARQ